MASNKQRLIRRRDHERGPLLGGALVLPPGSARHSRRQRRGPLPTSGCVGVKACGLEWREQRTSTYVGHVSDRRGWRAGVASRRSYVLGPRCSRGRAVEADFFRRFSSSRRFFRCSRISALTSRVPLRRSARQRRAAQAVRTPRALQQPTHSSARRERRRPPQTPNTAMTSSLVDPVASISSTAAESCS